MRLSIIIVSWNIVDLLAKCLNSIYNAPPKCEFEVLVVDNASADNSVEMVKQQFPQVTLFPNHINIGFAPANNQAIRQSTGQYTLLLNPDTEVHASALDALVRFLDENPTVGAVGPLTLNPDGSLQTSCYPLPTLSKEFWRLFHLDKIVAYGSYNMARWSRANTRQVEALLGACLLVRREILDKIGLLDEDYFIYSEEIDLCYRIKKAGWSLYWVPWAKIIHYGGQSTQQVAAEMFLRLYQGKVLYFQKHYSWLTVILYKLIIMAASLPRVLISPVAWLNTPRKRQKYLAVAGNYRRLMQSVFKM